MSSNCLFLASTVGRKYLMALTGIGWSLFVFMHMAGNMFILVSPEAYNRYGHAIVSNPFLLVFEVGLVSLLLIHVVTAFSLKSRNLRTKPVRYAVSPSCEKPVPLTGRTMIYTGSILLAFIIFHLITFKWGPVYTVMYNGVEMRDLHRLVVEKFADPTYCFGYVIVMFFVGMHLYHGVQSSFQTLGVYNKRYMPFIKCFGYTYAIVVALGFMIQPIYVFFVR